MQKNSNHFSPEEAMRLANSPAGQQLLAALRNRDNAHLQQAAQLATDGNYTQAQQVLQGLLNDPQIQSLLAQLGRQ